MSSWEIVSAIEERQFHSLVKVRRVSDGLSALGISFAAESFPIDKLGKPSAALLAVRTGQRIPRLLDSVVNEGRVLFIYDAFVHQSLASALENKLLPFQRGLELTLRIADAIRELHRAGAVHGRLCPECIGLDRNGAPTLLGYGLGVAGGPLTAPFIDPSAPPENPFDAHADQYAVAVIAYMIATGHIPFDPAETARNGSRAPRLPPAVGKRSSNWPIAALDLLNRAVSLDRSARPGTITEFRNLLAETSPLEIRAELEPESREASAVTGSPKFSRYFLWMVTFAAVVAILVLR